MKKWQKSTVYPGVGMTTAMYFPPFYDEEGNYHDHDANTTTTNYSCSNGHKWVKNTTGSCWCGWPDKEKKMKQEVRTYSELIDAIAKDVKGLITGYSMESMHCQLENALHNGRTRALIAEFVGYRHIELREKEKQEK